MTQRITQTNKAVLQKLAQEKYGTVLKQRASACRIAQDESYDVPERITEPVQAVKKPYNRCAVMAKGAGIMIAILIIVPYLYHVGQEKYDNVKYGMPRTIQVDAVVGHSDSKESPSHFIVENLHGQILVIELPGGSSKDSIVYVGPHLNNEDVVAEPSFFDVNKDGKVDMVVRFQSSAWICLNDGREFSTKQIPIESLQNVK